VSYEAWGDDDDGHDGCSSEERVVEAFASGAQAAREMLARFIEQGGDAATAASVRANWHPSWGPDPGKLDGEIPEGPWA
jgi:hypothetical protein